MLLLTPARTGMVLLLSSPHPHSLGRALHVPYCDEFTSPKAVGGAVNTHLGDDDQ